MMKLPTFKFQLHLVLILCLALLAVQCAPAAEPERITTRVSLGPPALENKLVATETLPLNNCNGNSPLRMDVERSREFVYAVIDKDGFQFGGQYSFLTALLEEEYSIVDGEKETQTHTLHLETKANSYVKYTLAWKETWLNGEANVKRGEDEKSVPYRVKKGLTLEVVGAEEIDCN